MNKNNDELMEFISDKYKQDENKLKSIYKTYRHLFIKNDDTHIFELFKPLSIAKQNIFDIDIIIKKSLDYDKDDCRLLGSLTYSNDSEIGAIEMSLGNNVFITKTSRFTIDNKTYCIDTWFIHNKNYIARFIENGVPIDENEQEKFFKSYGRK